jgi:phosphate transport system permease protein
MDSDSLTNRRFGPQKAGPRNRNDQRAELLLGALACVVLALIAGMIIFVFQKAWPSFSHNGLPWFGPGGDVNQQLTAIFESPGDPAHYVYTLHAWSLIYATALITFCAVVLGLAMALLSAMFIVEFAPEGIRRILEPVVRLLAAVPSVIYGLIGILVIVPFLGQHIITEGQKNSVAGVIALGGSSIGVGILILTIMITPIMIAIVVDALRAVPRDWNDGAVALGINRFRALWTVGVRAARPAIVAAAVLATARALGEAIMLSMVTGSVAFAPNPLDGLIFFYEPAQPIAATIVANSEGLSVTPFAQTLYAFAAVLLVSAGFLSFGGWYIRRRLRKFTLSPI